MFNWHFVFFSHSQLSVMQVGERRVQQPHWVVRKEEVMVTTEVLGRGGWREVRIARFCGLRVAAKFLYEVYSF